MFIPSFKCERGDKDFLPSVAEVGFSILFLIGWLFPIIVSWFVALSGLRFSYVAPNRQLANLDHVGLCVLISLCTGIAAAIVVLIIMGYMLKPNKFYGAEWRMSWIQRFFVLVVAFISVVGVYKSFGGVVFYKSYSGPSLIWLGYGAWSVTLLFSLSYFIGEFIYRRTSFLAIQFLFTVIYLPILLSGSRIDYLSLMIALSAYIFHLSEGGFLLRAIRSLVVIGFSIVVSFFVGKIRYGNFGVPQNFSEATFEMGLSRSGMFYLSTLGDVGVSFFQIIGLIKEGAVVIVGAPMAVLGYLERLLPGSFFPDRPGDLAGLMPEEIGGGALHSLGEVYLIGGVFGCISLAAAFGALVAVSIFFGRQLKYSQSPVFFVVFVFPWLLLIRGGWYQLFAVIKSMEILLVIWFCLAVIGGLQKRFRSMSVRGRVC